MAVRASASGTAERRGTVRAVTKSAADHRTTRWLNASEMRAWRQFIETHDDLRAAFEADLAPTGLTLGDYQVLVYLSESEQRAMRMCDLAEILQLSPSGLTRRLDGLVAGGQVVRQGSEEDRRVMMAVLTDDGMAVLRRTAPHHLASVRRHVFDHLDAAQVAALGSIFEAISTGLREEQPVGVDA